MIVQNLNWLTLVSDILTINLMKLSKMKFKKT